MSNGFRGRVRIKEARGSRPRPAGAGGQPVSCGGPWAANRSYHVAIFAFVAHRRAAVVLLDLEPGGEYPQLRVEWDVSPSFRQGQTRDECQRNESAVGPRRHCNVNLGDRGEGVVSGGRGGLHLV